MATDIGLAKIEADSDGILLQFDPEPRTPPTQILAFAQARRDTSFAGQDRLRIKVASKDTAECIQTLRSILQALLPKAAAEPSAAPSVPAGTASDRKAAKKKGKMVRS